VLVATIVKERQFTPTPQLPTVETTTETVDLVPTPRIKKIVTVDANVRWEDSGVSILEGDSVKISWISGAWGGLLV